MLGVCVIKNAVVKLKAVVFKKAMASVTLFSPKRMNYLNSERKFHPKIKLFQRIIILQHFIKQMKNLSK